MFNMAFDVLTMFWRLEFFVSCNNIITRTSFFCSVFLCKFFKKIIVLHHGDNNFLFYFDICNQIHIFNNNLKDEEMITSLDVCHKFFMIKMLQRLCYNFLMIKIADKPWQIGRCLRIFNLKSANDCFWNLFFQQDSPFDNLHFRLKLVHICFSLRFL